jgi:hypothetical protein
VQPRNQAAKDPKLRKPHGFHRAHAAGNLEIQLAEDEGVKQALVEDVVDQVLEATNAAGQGDELGDA